MGCCSVLNEKGAPADCGPRSFKGPSWGPILSLRVQSGASKDPPGALYFHSECSFFYLLLLFVAFTREFILSEWSEVTLLLYFDLI